VTDPPIGEPASADARPTGDATSTDARPTRKPASTDARPTHAPDATDAPPTREPDATGDPATRPFAYALLRVVPSIERGEQLNVGVVVFCRQHDFLALRAELDDARLAALAPGFDPQPIRSRLAALTDVVRGDPRAGAVAQLPQSERFGWIVAPASTIIQPSVVHTGLTDDPQAALDRLFAELVGRPA
jgi:DUF3037 family protein